MSISSIQIQDQNMNRNKHNHSSQPKNKSYIHPTTLNLDEQPGPRPPTLQTSNPFLPLAQPSASPSMPPP